MASSRVRKIVQLTEQEAAAVAEVLSLEEAPERVLSRDELRQLDIGAPPER